MRISRTSPDASRAVELAAVVGAERELLPFLVVADPDGQRVIVLEPADERLWIGREPEREIALPHDAGVSRVHAELVRVADGWAVVDDGLSRNGTAVDGERITGRRVLHDGARISLGSGTELLYRTPGPTAGSTAATDLPVAPELTAMQRRVLVELCRPLRDGRVPATPATNREIAQELVLSEEAVKTHLRALFTKFGLADLGQNRKRTRLAELAILTGVA